ncbi:hypothetical protein QLQ12_20785 [Actinoplanes sp. NEAU-A12]|uniref:Uncharacterized protein n=1 Tax=Actinoplanes sandaracinus TaxID=3045177 RepID=A0ABT6WMV7_9ACTN|nr:hypothetical protein [Actinoplanes sandaracinus]MDI6101054.1 hypothetical protein [Actinoplanes sandaracinus]
MDENELRAALRTTIMLNPEPPPMESRTAIAAGRRAARRRNLLACGGAATAILAITVAAIPGQGYFNDGGTGIAPAAGPSGAVEPFPTRTPAPLGSVEVPPVTPSGEKTEPSWPAEASGDATADSGDHFDKGKALLAELVKLAPDGYTLPEGSVADGIELRSHQATIEGDHWAYMTAIALRKGERTGQLLVETREPGNGLPSDVCEVARAFWGRGGACAKRTVGGAEVGVVSGPDEAWSAYRHSDGTVVYVMQSKATSYGDVTGFTPLEKLPLSTAELAELATSEAFR